MYKVYRDPQGTKYLESNNSPQITNKSFVTTDNEETYKRRIESLNKEIQVLNSELEKVAKPYSYLTAIILPAVCFSFLIVEKWTS